MIARIGERPTSPEVMGRIRSVQSIAHGGEAMQPTIARMLGRQEVGPVSAYAHGGSDSNMPTDPSIQGSVAIPGMDFQGRLSAAMIGAIVIAMVVFHVATKGYQL